MDLVPSAAVNSGDLSSPRGPAAIRVLDIVKSVVSGGQTGVDRAALDLAMELNLPTGGWCPHGSQAEDGVIDSKYKLSPTPTADPAQRTEWNVRDSDGTLVIAENQLVRGTLLTVEMAVRYRRPYLILFVNQPFDANYFAQWVGRNLIATLNIAGPRESDEAGLIYPRAKALLAKLLTGEFDPSQFRWPGDSTAGHRKASGD